MFKAITRTVWILSLISLFNDAASELLIPVMPIYLKSIGFSVVLIGVLEGLAEATAGLTKGYFGHRSDLRGRRAPFVRIGYAMSALAKPMMAVIAHPFWVFGARTLDRLGKGVRTAARDALLSEESMPTTKGAIFGFHRSMDTVGAVIGPALALVFLYFHPEEYRTLFVLAIVPGIISVAISFLVKDKGTKPKHNPANASFFAFLGYWKRAPRDYRTLVVGLLAFALFNSADAFLLLRAKTAGLNDTGVIGIYIFYNLVFALASFPLGHLADRIGLKPTLLSGLVLFALVYFGMALEGGLFYYGALFLLYGLYAAATDGVSKAWLASLADKKDTATALGFFSGLQSIAALVASSVTGLLWYRFGAAAAFFPTGAVTVAVVVYLQLAIPRDRSAD